MPLTNKEFIEALSEVEQEYESLRASNNSHDRKIAKLAMFVLNKLKRRGEEEPVPNRRPELP